MSDAHNSESPVIIAENLEKTFGAVRALDGLNLEVSSGQIHGFLGPNGAGKSTAMRIFLGILQKTAGRVQVFGRDPWKDAAELHRRIAYVPAEVDLWPNLTGGEALDLFASLRGGISKEKQQHLIDRFELDPSKKGRTYSKGNRQKVALVSALSSDAELFLLDEPTSGLDPLMEAVFQQSILEAKNQGGTVLLSSHILAQVEALSDRISIIRTGRIVETGALRELQHLSRTHVMVEVKSPVPDLGDWPGVLGVQHAGEQITFEADTEHLAAIMKGLSALGILSITAAPPTLEQILLRHYGSHTAAEST